MSRSRAIPFLAVLLFASPACDEIVRIKNVPPRAEASGYCTDGDRQYFLVDVTDHEREPVDVEIIATLDGRRLRIPTGTTGDGLAGLRSDRHAPVTHAIEWAPDCVAEVCDPPTCAPDTCFDPCTIPPTTTIALVTACLPLPSDPPDTIFVEVFADDGRDQTTTTAELSRADSCPN